MDIDKTLKEMSLENKVKLCIDGALWRTAAIPENDVPILYMSDGTNGLRFWKNQKDQDPMSRDFSSEFGSMTMDDEDGINRTYEATCFPTGSALACSWDRGLAQEIAAAVANECKSHEVGMLFGPAMNTRRHPLDCRGFEYFSEDPCLAGEMAGSYVIGLQENEVSGTLKHFVCNNQNFQRTNYDSVVEERALREIYLAAFERAIKVGHPGCIMVSYNLLNGVQACENPWLMTQVLREEWGYDGLIISDSSAVKDAVKAYEAGMDWIMPFSLAYRNEVVEAVRSGRMKEETVDFHARKVLEAVARFSRHGKPVETVDYAAHHRLAQKAAAGCGVLLKNDGILPIGPGRVKSLAVIGRVAEEPVYQGSGCACVHAVDVDSPLEAIRKECGARGISMAYVPCYDADDNADDAMIAEAAAAASKADAAIVFAAARLPHEDDGYNRSDIRLNGCHDRLVAAVAAAQPDTAVVLNNNESVELPWNDDVNAILDMWYAGEGSGKAVSDLLFGNANPSGKLPVTFPMRLEDTPAYLNFPGENERTVYGEGIYVGYRYYEKRSLKPRYAFGHGLSYTSFAYSDIKVSAERCRLGDGLRVSLRIRNTGTMAGAEVVQLYIHDGHSRLPRPVKELKGFEKVFLEPGEEREVSFTLAERDFQYYDTLYGGWIADSGEFGILVGSSSDDIRLEASVYIESPQEYVPLYRNDTHFSEIMGNPTARKLFYAFMLEHGFLKLEQVNEATDISLSSTFWGVGQYMDYMVPAEVTPEMIRDLVDRINKAVH